MIITISLSESDLQRISDVLGLTEYNDIHDSIVKAYGDMLDRKEGLMNIEINPNYDCAEKSGRNNNMSTFCAFASFDSKELGYNDVFIEAESKEDARLKFAELCECFGDKSAAVLSDTSEEVYFIDKNGNEIVYYGFEEE